MSGSRNGDKIKSVEGWGIVDFVEPSTSPLVVVTTTSHSHPHFLTSSAITFASSH